jgi:hypothetical protein
MQAFRLMLGSSNAADLVVGIFSLLFLYGIFINLVSWAYGINSLTLHAATEGNLPAIFAFYSKNGFPIGVTLLNGIIASCTVLFCYKLSVMGSTERHVLELAFSYCISEHNCWHDYCGQLLQTT